VDPGRPGDHDRQLDLRQAHQTDTLNLSTTQAASLGTVYLLGEVLGALVFGKLSDKLGRRRLFMWTLGIYLVGTGLSAFAFTGTAGLAYFYATRIIAGAGIGGEYAAINAAIDEMMPARYRGRTDIWINGTYWLGSIIGTLAAFLLLNSLPADTGWRAGFLVGPVLAVVILVVRRSLPESPRWLLTHGREQEALESMKHIEDVSIRDGQHLSEVHDGAGITIKPEKEYGYLTGLSIGYLVGGGLMIIGGLVEMALGIDAERKPLEQVARPLTQVDAAE
jgi:MFS family permease